MITTILPCDQCGVVDITAELPLKGPLEGQVQRLCPVHYGMVIGRSKGAIRNAMGKALFMQAERRVPKTFDTALAKAA
jgi:hypothetical protein